jgi:hypothetical protein
MVLRSAGMSSRNVNLISRSSNASALLTFALLLRR